MDTRASEERRRKKKDRDPERRECMRTKREEKSLSRRTRSSAETVIFIAQVGFNIILRIWLQIKTRFFHIAFGSPQ